MEELTADQLKALAGPGRRPRRAGPTPGSVLTRACLALLAARGVFAWRSNNIPVYDATTGRMRAFAGLRGIADILGVLATSGRFLAVEVKAGRDKLSAEQRAFLDNVTAAGGLAVVVRDVAELVEVLDALGL